MSNSQRAYCFTSFLTEINPDESVVRYMIIGRETCPTTGKKHLQGYAEFKSKITFKTAQKAIGDPSCHIEIRRGSREQARDYCKKENDWVEIGDWNAGGQGSRTDLKYGPADDIHRHNCETVLKWIEDGDSDYEILKKSPFAIYKYKTFITRSRRIIAEENSLRSLDEYAKLDLNETQRKIEEHCEKQNERQITWVYDRKGGSGKTWWSKFKVASGDCFRCENARTRDIAFAYNRESTVIFDFSRTLEGRVNYQVIESIKNGFLFSSKYESCSKIFKPPKIVVLANFTPEFGALSADRWDLITV